MYPGNKSSGNELSRRSTLLHIFSYAKYRGKAHKVGADAMLRIDKVESCNFQKVSSMSRHHYSDSTSISRRERLKSMQILVQLDKINPTCEVLGRLLKHFDQSGQTMRLPLMVPAINA